MANGPHSQAKNFFVKSTSPKIPRVLHSCGRRRRDLRRGAMGADDVSNPLAPDYANPVPEKPKPKSNADFRKVRAPPKAQRLTILLFDKSMLRDLTTPTLSTRAASDDAEGRRRRRQGWEPRRVPETQAKVQAQTPPEARRGRARGPDVSRPSQGEARGGQPGLRGRSGALPRGGPGEGSGLRAARCTGRAPPAVHRGVEVPGRRHGAHAPRQGIGFCASSQGPRRDEREGEGRRARREGETGR